MFVDEDGTIYKVDKTGPDQAYHSEGDFYEGALLTGWWEDVRLCVVGFSILIPLSAICVALSGISLSNAAADSLLRIGVVLLVCLMLIPSLAVTLSGASFVSRNLDDSSERERIIDEGGTPDDPSTNDFVPQAFYVNGYIMLTIGCILMMLVLKSVGSELRYIRNKRFPVPGGAAGVGQ